MQVLTKPINKEGSVQQFEPRFLFVGQSVYEGFLFMV